MTYSSDTHTQTQKHTHTLECLACRKHPLGVGKKGYKMGKGQLNSHPQGVGILPNSTSCHTSQMPEKSFNCVLYLFSMNILRWPKSSFRFFR